MHDVPKSNPLLSIADASSIGPYDSNVELMEVGQRISTAFMEPVHQLQSSLQPSKMNSMPTIMSTLPTPNNPRFQRSLPPSSPPYFVFPSSSCPSSFPHATSIYLAELANNRMCRLLHPLFLIRHFAARPQ